MKFALVIAIFLCGAVDHAAAGTFLLAGSADRLARKMQARLPGMAVDGLVEARRKDGDWNYVFYTRLGKIVCDQVQVGIRVQNAYQSLVTVKAIRVDGGFFWSSTNALPEETLEWDRKIKRALLQPSRSDS